MQLTSEVTGRPRSKMLLNSAFNEPRFCVSDVIKTAIVAAAVLADGHAKVNSLFDGSVWIHKCELLSFKALSLENALSVC